jgi:hypothetical protein
VGGKWGKEGGGGLTIRETIAWAPEDDVDVCEEEYMYSNEDRSCKAITPGMGSSSLTRRLEPKVKGKCICRYDIGWFYGTISRPPLLG